jgi:hypothetical protein
MSPNTQFKPIDYSIVGVPIEEPNFAGVGAGICASGIHVIPISEDADLSHCLYSDQCIYLEVDEEDIIYRENNGKMRCKKVTPMCNFNREHPLWGVMVKNPTFAFNYARYVDKFGMDDTRKICSSNSASLAYSYAVEVDKKYPHDDTRNGCLNRSWYAGEYARWIDKVPRNDTRKAVCQNAEDAYSYAMYVDKCATPETRKACKSSRSLIMNVRYENAFGKPDNIYKKLKRACRKFGRWMNKRID